MNIGVPALILHRIKLFVLSCAVLICAAHADAGTIEQSDSVFVGTPGIATQPVTLDQFNPNNGTLTAVTFDVYSSMFAEAVTNGGGGSTILTARLIGDFEHDGTSFGHTQIVISDNLSNAGPPFAILYFGEDSSLVTVTDPAIIARYVGSGQIDVDLTTALLLGQDPQIVKFGGAGSIEYTVTYEFSDSIAEDVNHDGSVNVDDLVAVILAWGDCDAPCDEDIDVNGAVDVDDLVAVILAWS